MRTLKQLSIRNFKSWKEIKDMRLAPITGLFGSNSSGKTSILQFLLLLKQTVEASDRSQVLNFGTQENLVSLGTFSDVVNNHDTTLPLEWSIKWSLPKNYDVKTFNEKKEKISLEGNEIELFSKVEVAPDGALRVNSFHYTLGDNIFGIKHKVAAKYELFAKSEKFHFARNPGRVWDLTQPNKFYGFPYEARTHYQNADFLWRLQFELERIFDKIFYLRPLRENPQRQYTWAGAKPYDVGQRGEKVIDALLASGKKKIPRGRGRRRLTLEEYVAYWLKELGLIYNFHVKPINPSSNLYEVWLQKSENATLVRITDVGFGISQILPVLVLCYYVPRNSIIMLEQPEIHLHPSAQSGLADVFIDAIKTRNIQVIFESHSEHLLKRLQRRIAEGVFSKDDAAIYFCDIKGGTSNLINLDLDLFGNITNWPKDFFGDNFGEIAATASAAIKRKRDIDEKSGR
jgi:predicted ATPase